MVFIETSALDSTGVTTAFHSLLTEIYHLTTTRHLINENRGTTTITQGQTIQLNTEEPESKGCCS